MKTENDTADVRLWLRSLLSGERCAACGVGLTGGVSLFCPECGGKLRQTRERICMDCGADQSGCFCSSPILREAGCEYLIKYGPYGTGEEDAPLDRLVLRMKNHRDRLLAGWIADALAPQISSLTAQRRAEAADFVLTWIPRSRARVREYGCDQARLLADALSSFTGIRCLSLLERAREGEQQKRLNADERHKNAGGLFRVRPCRKQGEEAEGKIVLLVDDLVTTGETMGECTRLLRAAGAREIIGVCAARTVLKLK